MNFEQKSGSETNEVHEKMSPQKMLEEIKNTYPTSHVFLQEVIEAGKDNWASNPDEASAQSVVVQLAQFHRSIAIHGEPTSNITDPREREMKMYERGLWLANIVGAVYHGELTMIDKDGKLLQEPVPFEKA
jgi:hypothetical protein